MSNGYLTDDLEVCHVQILMFDNRTSSCLSLQSNIPGVASKSERCGESYTHIEGDNLECWALNPLTVVVRNSRDIKLVANGSLGCEDVVAGLFVIIGWRPLCGVVGLSYTRGDAIHQCTFFAVCPSGNGFIRP